MPTKELTTMEKFVVDILSTTTAAWTNPNHIAYLWAEKNKTGSAGSRGMFGNTAAAYKALRNLTKKGIVEESQGRFPNYRLVK